MNERVVILTGGVGGAKLVLGICNVFPAEQVTAIVNTGDDFDHFGLRISPDLDTLLYTLAGKANAEQGWGRAGESWNFMAALSSLGGEGWFRLGDGDLALHVLRTARLHAGENLTAITADFARSWQVGASLLPMSNDPIATILATDEGKMPFQRYFVARRCEPRMRAIRFEGAQTARAAPGVVEAITDPATTAILIAPSNPYLSIDPILSVAKIRSALEQRAAPAIAVSPIVGGNSVKGPTAKLMVELGLPVSNATIASHYAGLIDGLLCDQRDGSGSAKALGVAVAATDTLMISLDDRIRVAKAALALADSLRS